MTPFTVNTEDASGLTEIVASLPLSLAPAADGAPQLAAIDGSPGWAERAQAALDGGALAAVVSSPSAEAADDDPRLVLDWSFASNPGMLAASIAAEPLRARIVLAEATLSVRAGTELEIPLLDVITAATRVFGDAAPLRSLHRDGAGWHLASRLSDGAPLSLSIVVTDAVPSALHLRLLTDDGGLTAAVPSPETAAPAEVRVVGRDGERLLPTLWETSRRASWRRAVAIAAGASVRTGADFRDIAEFHRTMSLAPR